MQKMAWKDKDYVRNKKKIVRLYKSRNIQELLAELLKIPCVELSKNGVKTPLPLDDRSRGQCYTAAYILKKLRSFPEGAIALR